jgi:hypothetical protein
VILSISLRSLDVSCTAVAWRTHCYGNHSSNCKAFNLDGLAAYKMSKFRQLLKLPTAVSGGIVFCGWVEMRLAGSRGVGSFKAILVDLQ